MRATRVGLVVPSSNTTMETEIPVMLRRRGAVAPERFTCHASRVRMRQVTPEELARMNAASDRCAEELADARCDILAYACLVAVMAEGAGAHTEAEQRLKPAATDALSLGVADNVEVGRLDPARLPELVAGLDVRDAKAIVLSACVQMPSLAAVPIVE